MYNIKFNINSTKILFTLKNFFEQSFYNSFSSLHFTVVQRRFSITKLQAYQLKPFPFAFQAQRKRRWASSVKYNDGSRISRRGQPEDCMKMKKWSVLCTQLDPPIEKNAEDCNVFVPMFSLDCAVTNLTQSSLLAGWDFHRTPGKVGYYKEIWECNLLLDYQCLVSEY